MTDANIQDLCPELLAIYREWLAECHVVGLATRAIVTWRSADEQNTAKAKGLSNASAGESPHNCCDSAGLPNSKAFDYAIFDGNAHYVTDGMDDRYRHAGEIGKSLGLVWGGDWTIEKDGCKPDWDHLQMKNWKTGQAEPVTT